MAPKFLVNVTQQWRELEKSLPGTNSCHPSIKDFPVWKAVVDN